jgi:hypothetical protein
MTPDQANDAKWKGAWTNLVNDVRQTLGRRCRTLLQWR